VARTIRAPDDLWRRIGPWKASRAFFGAHGDSGCGCPLSHPDERGPSLGQLSAAFVLPVEDALSNGRLGLRHAPSDGARASVRRWTGFSFSRPAPQNDVVRSRWCRLRAGVVMKLYDA